MLHELAAQRLLVSAAALKEEFRRNVRYVVGL
jgi:hypothetical protein